MKQRLLLCLLAALFLCGPNLAAHAQAVLWVNATDAKLKSSPSASASTLATLEVGTRVETITAEGRWYKVRTSRGQEGWLYRGKLSETQPSKEVAAQDDLFAALGGSQISSKDASTSRSIRGLSKETEAYATVKGTPPEYKQALETVLSWSVSQQELEKFLAVGKIGEYAAQ